MSLVAGRFLPLILATAVACGGGTSPRTPTATGTWTGSVSNLSVWTLELAELEGGFISGNAVARNSAAFGGDSHFRVDGIHRHPSISLNLTSPVFSVGPPLTFIGQFVHPDTLSGMMGSSGLRLGRR